MSEIWILKNNKKKERNNHLLSRLLLKYTTHLYECNLVLLFGINFSFCFWKVCHWNIAFVKIANNSLWWSYWTLLSLILTGYSSEFLALYMYFLIREIPSVLFCLDFLYFIYLFSHKLEALNFSNLYCFANVAFYLSDVMSFCFLGFSHCYK